jgi:hypothetical protein
MQSQSGNMLVLAAIWRMCHMRKLIEREHFEVLPSRTTSFLQKLSPISPTYQLDKSILEKVQHSFGLKLLL